MTKINLSKIDMNKLNINNLPGLDPELISKSMVAMQSTIHATSNIKNMIEESEKLAHESYLKKEQYDQDVLNTLKKIEGNTANLTTLVNLIQSSNEKQSETYEIITELLALAKEKDKEVVESKYRKIMNKITTFTEDVETITTLTSFGISIFNILKQGA